MLTQHLNINKNILTQFEMLIARNRLAHAYIFTGPQMAGKSETALLLAHAINGGISFEEARKGVSPAVMEKIKTNDPDIHWVPCPYGETIKIEMVREILSKSRLKPYFSPKSVFVIQNIDQLTIEGANALLKTLEEPSADSLLFLTTSSPDKVLPTISSRCQSVYFASLPNDEVAAQLASNYEVKEKESQFLAFFAEGCMGKALNFKEQDLFQNKNEYINEFIYQQDIEPFIKRITAEKHDTKVLLDVLLSWARDAMLLKSGISGGRLINADREIDLDRFQSRFSMDDLLDMYKDVVNAQKLLAQNLNIKLPLSIIKERCYG